jgi:hypothetical protein
MLFCCSKKKESKIMPDPPIIKSPPKNSVKKDESKIDFKSEDNELERGFDISLSNKKNRQSIL